MADVGVQIASDWHHLLSRVSLRRRVIPFLRHARLLALEPSAHERARNIAKVAAVPLGVVLLLLATDAYQILFPDVPSGLAFLAYFEQNHDAPLTMQPQTVALVVQVMQKAVDSGVRNTKVLLAVVGLAPTVWSLVSDWYRARRLHRLPCRLRQPDGTDARGRVLDWSLTPSGWSGLIAVASGEAHWHELAQVRPQRVPPVVFLGVLARNVVGGALRTALIVVLSWYAALVVGSDVFLLAAAEKVADELERIATLSSQSDRAEALRAGSHELSRAFGDAWSSVPEMLVAIAALGLSLAAVRVARLKDSRLNVQAVLLSPDRSVPEDLEDLLSTLPRNWATRAIARGTERMLVKRVTGVVVVTDVDRGVREWMARVVPVHGGWRRRPVWVPLRVLQDIPHVLPASSRQRVRGSSR